MCIVHLLWNILQQRSLHSSIMIYLQLQCNAWTEDLETLVIFVIQSYDEISKLNL